MHREPQPVKLYTIATIYRYARRRAAASASTGNSPSRRSASADPALDAEVIQLYTRSWPPPRRRLHDPAELDRRSAVPPGLHRALAGLARGARRRARRGPRERARRNPLRALDNIAAKLPAVARGSCARRLRLATRFATPAASTSPGYARFLDAYGVRYEFVPTLVRGLDYYTRTTWEFIGPPDEGVRRAPFPVAGATTGWPKSWAASTRLASASAQASSG